VSLWDLLQQQIYICGKKEQFLEKIFFLAQNSSCDPLDRGQARKGQIPLKILAMFRADLTGYLEMGGAMSRLGASLD
jgi:hypothetical protein